MYRFDYNRQSIPLKSLVSKEWDQKSWWGGLHEHESRGRCPHTCEVFSNLTNGHVETYCTPAPTPDAPSSPLHPQGITVLKENSLRLLKRSRV